MMRSLFLAILLATPMVVQAQTVTESETGKSFKATIDGAEKDRKLICTGTGCREATFFAVNVYAIAHWADGKALAESLKAWKGKGPAALDSDQSFFDALCAADVEKRFRMEFVRNVEVEKIRDAFKDSLVKAYGTLPAIATEFIGLFKEELKEGSSIELRSLPGGIIEAYQNDKLLKKFPADKALATNVWKIWFQKELADDYLKTVKKNLVGRVIELWKS